MSSQEERETFREQLNSDTCIQPASVFDPVSARIAELLGYEVGMLPGSVASAVTVGMPDLALMTLTEFAGLARRVTRVGKLSLLVDADHGYGNALNVMRTVEELENAGVSALTIEDVVLPARFGSYQSPELISVPEMVGKLRAALRARQDPSLVIVGRTVIVESESFDQTFDQTLERVRAYVDTGVDALFLVGLTSREQLEEVRRTTDLPLLLGARHPDFEDKDYLASQGVRVIVKGHRPFQEAVKAVYEALSRQRGGAEAEAGELEGILGRVLREGDYGRMQRDYLGG